ncbi:MAG: hppD [Betaproteobacteria bacterium]|nr:hppD [Betaproteobacteria bacterium]
MEALLPNPAGTDGFEFIEYTAPDTRALALLFESMGLVAAAQHRSKDVTLYRQGGVNFVLNHEPHSFAQAFARVHGPSVCAFAIRVKDAAHAYQRAIGLGAKPHRGDVGPMELNIPAIRGIGGSLIYLVDRYRDRSIYDVDFVAVDPSGKRTEGNPRFPSETSRPSGDAAHRGAGLLEIDHITHNVHQGRMDHWTQFYERLFGFREIRYFDIHGEQTGLRSRALVSPCGKIRIPINEPSDDKSQVEEFLDAYHGEGIQHIALATADIYESVEALAQSGVRFMHTPRTYYEAVDSRIPGHGEDAARLERNQILIDGRRGDLLLQIFTETVIGPIFFEIIQRKGNEGFGEGNFQALFEAIERDQVARGVI